MLPSVLIAVLALAEPTQFAGNAGGGFEKSSTLYGPSQAGLFGRCLAPIGDVDGDGIGDLLVGAPGHDEPGITNSGLVQVYSGATQALIHSHPGTMAYETVGIAVTALDDIDADLVLDYAYATRQGGGTVHLCSGATGTLIRTIPAPVDALEFGSSLHLADDMSGDGVPDLMVGAENSLVAGLAVGKTYLIDTSTGSVIREWSGSAVGDAFGRQVSSIADINSNGFPEAVIAAPGTDSGGLLDSGAVVVFDGNTGVELLRVDGTHLSGWFGSSLVGLNDLDGDGLADFAAGSIYDAGMGVQVGAFGTYSSASGLELLRYTGNDTNEQFAATLAAGGDCDGDGIEDILVGAPGSLYEGRVYLYSGASGVGAETGILAKIENEGDHDFGYAVARADDLDLDGIADLFIGAPSAEDLGVETGAVVVCLSKVFLTADSPTFSSAAGGTITYSMDFPPDTTGGSAVLNYQLLASAVGTGPTALGGFVIPLTNDSMFVDTLNKRYPGMVANPFGNLDLNGDGSFSLTFLPGQADNLVGSLFWLSVGWSEVGSLGFVLHGFSSPVSLEVLP